VSLYTLTFVLAMNKDRYESLPADLQKVIDDNSGLEFSVFAGGTQADADGPARQAAVDRGNTIITVSGADIDAWRAAGQPIYDEWVADMNARGKDGQALLDEARMLIEKYTPQYQ
jgi:C4-dicarboxylate-binding protein DctP